VLNPAGWWKFVIAAVITVNAKKRSPAYDQNGRFDPDSEIPHRSRGWVGFVKALQSRKRYFNLFRAFVRADLDFREKIHEEIVAFERELLVSEIAAYRLYVFEWHVEAYTGITGFIVPTITVDADEIPKELDDSERKMLFAPESTAKQLLNSFVQVVSTLKARQKDLYPPDQTLVTVNGLATTWKTSIRCFEFSVQVNDSKTVQARSPRSSFGLLSSPFPSTPVVKLSCAFSQEQEICRNGSWSLTTQIGSLVVNDCSVNPNQNVRGNLLGPKAYSRDEWNEEDTFKLDAITFLKTVWIHIERTKTYGTDGSQLGSSTRTLARVLPLELVYLSGPIETLNHIGQIFNDDFAADYHRFAHSLTHWRERQKRRLLMALAHKHKKLYIDIVIGAPVILVPENSAINSQLLVVDLGQLRFSDDSNFPESSASTFDDKWQLQIKSVQVQRLIGQQQPRDCTAHQIVEPFSLEFALWTRVTGDSQDDSSALIQATLPRLKINISSSAIHMFRLLQAQWDSLKDARESNSPAPDEEPGTFATTGKRSLEVQFNAPLLDMQLEHDYLNVKVFDLSLKGISGRYEQTRGQDFSSSHFTAKVQTLVVVDTFGNPKHDYSLLVSSVPTSIGVPGGSMPDSTFFDTARKGTDLVSISYDSRRSAFCRRGFELDIADKLEIRFYELFVNWNPESLSLIMRTLTGNPDSRLQQTEDDFFDAEEDKFYDTVDPSRRSSSPTRSILSDMMDRSVWDKDTSTIPKFQMLEVVFTMSRLRVNFNRDDRNRKVFSAEMVQTTVRHTKMTNGGSRTHSTIGNLTLSDLSSITTGTLYRDIMGLKTTGDEKSLVSIELICNPKARQYKMLGGVADDPMLEIGKPLSIDEESGRVHGFDYYMNARFSPMRFVYIQQVWFEIVDYFYSGIIGNEVWGPGDVASQPDQSILEGRSIDAFDVSFTRFDIEMERPVILVPVHSCSTDYLQLDISRISLKNRYSFDRMRPDELRFKGDGGNRQWYNTCYVEIHRIRAINGASRSALSPEENMPSAILRLNWPTGPSAWVNMPKWKVTCDIESVTLRVEQSDYALLQNLVQYNLGETSRHMKEWEYFLSLTSLGKATYLERSAVHFGYDQKDAMPSTFMCAVCFDGPQITFVNSSGMQIAALKSNRMNWSYNRLEDRISHQTISCDPLLNASDGTIIFHIDPDRKVPSRQIYHGFVYVSSTEPSGLNTRVISAVAPAATFPSETWHLLVDFFKEVIDPNYLAPDEAIQVGDRWYRIGEESTTHRPSCFQSVGPKLGADVIDYSLEINLTFPIVNMAYDCDVSWSSNSVHYRYVRRAMLIAQFIKITDMYLGLIGSGPTKLPVLAAKQINDEYAINSECDFSVRVDVSDIEILVSPRVVKCLSHAISSLHMYSRSRNVGIEESHDWDTLSEAGTEATGDSIMSTNDSTILTLDLSIRRFNAKIVNDDRGESVNVCSVKIEGASMSQRQQVTPDDYQRLLSWTVSVRFRSVEVCSQGYDPVLSIRCLNEGNSAVELSLVDRTLECKQQVDLSFMQTLADLKPAVVRDLIDTVKIYCTLFSDLSNNANVEGPTGQPISRSLTVRMLEFSCSLFDGTSEVALFEAVGRQGQIKVKESSELSLMVRLSVREFSVFGVSSNLLHRLSSAPSDTTDFLLMQYGSFQSPSCNQEHREYPSWMVAEIVKNEDRKSLLMSKVAAMNVTLLPESVGAVIKLLDDWTHYLHLSCPSTLQSEGSRPKAILVDIDMSKTTINILSDPENGAIVMFGKSAQSNGRLLTIPT
jgi:Repeating coiled region of VPS13